MQQEAMSPQTKADGLKKWKTEETFFLPPLPLSTHTAFPIFLHLQGHFALLGNNRSIETHSEQAPQL